MKRSVAIAVIAESLINKGLSYKRAKDCSEDALNALVSIKAIEIDAEPVKPQAAAQVKLPAPPQAVEEKLEQKPEHKRAVSK